MKLVKQTIKTLVINIINPLRKAIKSNRILQVKYFNQVNKKIIQKNMYVGAFGSLILFFASCFNENSINSKSIIAKFPVADSIKTDTIDKGNIFKELKLVKIIQSKVMSPKNPISVYESAINSPKSITYSKDGSKFYVNSLEGHTTIVFDSKSFKKLKEIRHEFNASNNSLFKENENTVFDYKIKQKRTSYNHFLGKPVESCLSHSGKYLWVTYYRRDWDPNAESPSAIAIIDTEKDAIVRVMPSGPLPKMIACSGNNKYIAVTHWGDNTVGLIDISSDNPMEFKYISHIVVDYRLNMDFAANSNRDSDCGNCLRGTIFTPDNKKLLIAKMGGNGIAVIDVETKKYLGTITGSYLNLRHLLINQGSLVLSSNKFGIVQKGNLDDIFSQNFNAKNQLEYTKWETLNVGIGARTIDITEDGKYVFACVNNESKIVVIDALKMKKIAEVDAAPFPVGMALSPDGKQLITTSQGKDSAPGSGNTVMVFEVIYEQK
jgi:DNA-binding beta-propeller fold protein YncE